MPQNPPPGMPRVTPYIYYQDVAAALDWLARAFGFRERVRMPGSDGVVLHGEMAAGEGGVIMLGCPGPEYRDPGPGGRVHEMRYVYVDDVDAHHLHAVESGARVLAVPDDKFYGDRTYSVEDHAGHQWCFAQHVRDVTPEEMRRAMG